MFDSEHLVLDWVPEEDHELLFGLTVAAYGEDVPESQHFLPSDLEDIVPGPFLAVLLSGVDRSRLSGYDVVRLLQSRERLVSHVQAGFYADIAEVAYAYDPDTPARDDVLVESAPEEIQTALMRTRRSADHDLGLALDLHHRMPQIRDAMAAGEIDLGRTRVFAQELASLHPALISAAVDRVIGDAGDLTTGQLRARLQKLVLELDPEGVSDRFQAGVEDRRMTVQSNPDLTASLLFHNADPKQVLLASRYVHGLALQLRRQGDPRSMDQLKVDIALDLLQGKTIPGAPPPPAQITIIIDQTAGHVPGYGPVLPETIQGLLETTATTLSSCGETCTHQTPSRRPTRAQRQHAQKRYPSCVWPGCRMPAQQCDLDHRNPWVEGGPTACHNLAPLCRHHHTCKPKWKLDRNPDGSHTWTSPLGHTYTTSKPP